ncbi:MAG: carboxypeptidase-like regulatory domain-containing protein, partial [Bacteroidales bacterium]
RFHLISIILIWQANSAHLYSQSTDYFDGKVINASTSDPVPFATIKLKYNQLGVYANAEGDFKIAANPEFRNDSLIITCIGYKQSSLAFNDLSEKTINKIFLIPVVYGLGEVKVVASRSKINSLAIIRRAIRKITNNYPVKPFSYIAYYRDYQKRESNYINLNEAIIQTLDNGFNSESSSNKYRMLDFRKNIDFPRMRISPYYELYASHDLNNPDKTIPKAILGDQYGNELFILMVHDAIRNFSTRSFSFIETFSADFILNHNFSEPSKVFNNNLLLYKIDFEARHGITGDSLQVSGAIYIQPKDYSIHKLEYNCYYKTKGEELKKMFNIDTEYGYDNDVDSLMCLKYISFNNIFMVVDWDDKTYFRILDSSLDTQSNIKSTIILHCSNKIDPVSASRKGNYIVIAGKKEIKIDHIQVTGRNIYLRFKDADLKTGNDSIRVDVENIKDINGNILDKRKSIELYQYRELFVQEYNKPLPLKDSCYMQYLPLENNCISKFSGKDKYWMNTPENIKINSK